MKWGGEWGNMCQFPSVWECIVTGKRGNHRGQRAKVNAHSWSIPQADWRSVSLLCWILPPAFFVHQNLMYLCPLTVCSLFIVSCTNNKYTAAERHKMSSTKTIIDYTANKSKTCQKKALFLNTAKAFSFKYSSIHTNLLRDEWYFIKSLVMFL